MTERPATREPPPRSAHSGERRPTLAQLIAPARTLALVGLAKNTGKTQTLTALLAALAAAGRRVGVTSIGRDGEERDVIDSRIAKPRVRLEPGSLVATTDALLRASAIPHDRLVATGIRTPLGQVLIAELHGEGTIEVAGPSSGHDVRLVAERMRELGAEQVLIDGAIDRRAASSPSVADGLVIATGAVLGEDIGQVVATTADAIDLVRLPQTRAATLAGERLELERDLVLTSDPQEIAALLREHPDAGVLGCSGALGERFLEGLLAARRERAGRELRIVVDDPTKVFLSRRGPAWYGRQGITIEVREPIELKAITVNPVAPESHRFDSAQLRALIEATVGDVPVLDVLDPSPA
ncbi:MAG TPA: hypothetical protein VEJ23_04535 [Solirubrobacteraceae bacterium]|nr:hypothetical protein [Solirubrobacteraceae bacterium]